MLITRVKGNIFPNLVGTEQKRLIMSLTADELKYTNPSTSTGMTAEATWKRIKHGLPPWGIDWFHGPGQLVLQSKVSWKQSDGH